MNEPAAVKRPFRPLSQRVVAWALLYGALFTLLMTAVLVGINYVEARETAVRQLRFAANSYKKSLANSLWELDMPAVRLQVDALANFPSVGRVVIESSIGQTIEAGETQGNGKGRTDTVDDLSWQEVLVSPERANAVVGRLRVYADHTAFLKHLQTSTVRILTAELIKGFAFGLLMAWLIGRLVTRHLADMEAQVASLNPASLGNGITLQRNKQEHEDELDRLCAAFNQLHRDLAGHIEAQRVLEAELRQHRDHLSDMVADRTHSLERLRSFHSLIIRVLTRFINLPPAQANTAVDHGLSTFGEYFGAMRCLLLMRDEAGRGFRTVNHWTARHFQSQVSPVFLKDTDLPPQAPESLLSRLWLSGTTSSAASPLSQALCNEAYTVVSVEIKGDAIGLLCLVGRAIAPNDDDADLLELAAHVAANMLDHKMAQMSLLATQQALEQANRELHELSRHDALTGLANRRHFDEVKHLEFRRAMRAMMPLSVLMCDIDQFKCYNDTYGHALGDRCLADVARGIGGLFSRAGDLVARLGGEEFVVLLPGINREHALAMGERMRQAVWNLAIPHVSSKVAPRVTISVGVATLKHGEHNDFDALLLDADRALYEAKTERNHVTIAE